MKRHEIAKEFCFLFECFQKIKKRFPFSVKDLEDFFQNRGHHLDFSRFYFLEIAPISPEKVSVRYSIKKGPNKYFKYIYQTIEIACSINESTQEVEVFPEPQFVGLWPELSK
jgi:hypothetical protein